MGCHLFDQCPSPPCPWRGPIAAGVVGFCFTGVTEAAHILPPSPAPSHALPPHTVTGFAVPSRQVTAPKSAVTLSSHAGCNVCGICVLLEGWIRDSQLCSRSWCIPAPSASHVSFLPLSRRLKNHQESAGGVENPKQEPAEHQDRLMVAVGMDPAQPHHPKILWEKYTQSQRQDREGFSTTAKREESSRAGRRRMEEAQCQG